MDLFFPESESGRREKKNKIIILFRISRYGRNFSFVDRRGEVNRRNLFEKRKRKLVSFEIPVTEKFHEFTIEKLAAAYFRINSILA